MSAEMAGCETVVTTELTGCKTVDTTGGRNVCSFGTIAAVEPLLVAVFVGVRQLGVFTANDADLVGWFEAVMT